MKPLYLFRLAAIGLFSKKLRTLLTAGGIAISVGVIIFMVSLAYGLQNIVTNEMGRSQSTKVVTVTSQKATKLKITEDYITKFKSITGVSSVGKVVNLSGRIIYHGTGVGLPIYAVSNDYFSTVPAKFISGKEFSYDKNSPSKMIVANKVVSDALSIKNPNDAVNKLVNMDFIFTKDSVPTLDTSTKTVTDNDYTIAGIIDEETQPIIYVPVALLEEKGIASYNQAKIVVDDAGNIDGVRQGVEQMGFQTTNIRDTIAQVNKVFNIIKILLGIFGLITLVVTVLGTLNTITITLVEQTREIGFLRLIGIRKGDVKNLFITQSILMSLTGTIAGIILGYIAASGANFIVYLVAFRSNLQSTSICSVPILIVIILAILAFAVGWAVGIVPARRAIGINPLKALRY